MYRLLDRQKGLPFYISPQVLDISSIESVQRRATRFVVNDYSYQSKAKLANHTTLLRPTKSYYVYTILLIDIPDTQLHLLPEETILQEQKCKILQ